MKLDVVKFCAGLIIVLVLLMCSGLAADTTWRHSGFTQWNYDINSYGLNNWNGTHNIAGYSYIIAFDPDNSTEIQAINGTTGAIDHSGACASTVIQAAINDIDNGFILIQKGTYDITSKISFKSGIYIEGEGIDATILNCITDGISIIGMEGDGPTGSDRFQHMGLSHIQLKSDRSVDVNGIEMKYIQICMFEDVYFYRIKGNALNIINSWDCTFHKILIEYCGDTSKYCVDIVGESGVGDTNNMRFADLYITHFYDTAVHIGPTVGSEVQHLNHFTDCKFHGQTGPLQSHKAVHCEGKYNFFTSCEYTQIASDTEAIIIDGDYNFFTNSYIGESGYAIKINSDYNIINGLISNAGAEHGINIIGNYNTVSNANLIAMDEWGFNVLGYRNIISDCILQGNKQGLIISGHYTKLMNVNAYHVGVTSGEAAEISSSKNSIVGGLYNGPGDKTIQFNAGSDNNRIVATHVGKAIIDNGANNAVSLIITG